MAKPKNRIYAIVIQFKYSASYIKIVDDNVLRNQVADMTITVFDNATLILGLKVAKAYLRKVRNMMHNTYDKGERPRCYLERVPLHKTEQHSAYEHIGDTWKNVFPQLNGHSDKMTR